MKQTLNDAGIWAAIGVSGLALFTTVAAVTRRFQSTSRWRGRVDADLAHLKDAVDDVRNDLRAHTDDERSKLDAILVHMGLEPPAPKRRRPRKRKSQ